MAHYVDILGLIAATLSAVMFLPQVIHTWQTGSAQGLSGKTLAVSATSMVLWLVYGVFTRNVPILFANSVSLLFTLTLVYFKLRFKAKPPARRIPRKS